MYELKLGEENMGEGFSTSDAVLTSAMSGGFGGNGGQWGNRGCASPFADPGSNAVRINAGNRATAAGIENLLDQNQFTATNTSIADGHNRICDHLAQDGNRVSDGMFRAELRTADMITAVKDGQFAAELRTGDRLRDIEREMTANARTAAQCCCDLKLQSCEDKAEILTAIADSKATALAVESRGIERTLNATQAELISLKTQVACGCCSRPS